MSVVFQVSHGTRGDACMPHSVTQSRHEFAGGELDSRRPSIEEQEALRAQKQREAMQPRNGRRHRRNSGQSDLHFGAQKRIRS
jgi:hypothetical protein